MHNPENVFNDVEFKADENGKCYVYFTTIFKKGTWNLMSIIHIR